MPQPTAKELLSKARSGDTVALGQLLEQYRGWLREQTAQQLRERLRARVDPSDIIQETYLEAQRDFGAFQGRCQAEWEGWLKRILENNLGEAVRHHIHVKKRSVRAERSIDGADSGVDALKNVFSADQPTPGTLAVRGEHGAILMEAVQMLLPDQREAIRLRYFEGCSLRDIAERLSRSEAAAASLLQRAVERLRSHLAKRIQSSQ